MECGYCKGKKSWFRQGFIVKHLDMGFFEQIKEKGWGRSGNYIYLQDFEASCCKAFEARLDVREFKMTKELKKKLVRFEKYLQGKYLPEKVWKNKERKEIEVSSGNPIMGVEKPEKEKKEIFRERSEKETKNEPQSYSIEEEKGKEIVPKAPEAHSEMKNEEDSEMKAGVHPGEKPKVPEVHSENPIEENKNESGSKPQKKEKRAGKSNETKANRGNTMEIEKKPSGKSQNKNKPSQMEEVNPELEMKPPDPLSVIDLSGIPPEQIPPIPVSLLTKSPKKFEMRIVKNTFSPDSFILYRFYSFVIHKKTIETEKAYSSFLCRNIFGYKTITKGAHPNITSLELGSFHIQYFINDYLAGISVVDLLPGSMTSCYFFYDPRLSFLSLGTISALKEIEFVQGKSKTFPDFLYWDPGSYIHSVNKMNYKAKFQPMQIKPPLNQLTWIYIKEIDPSFLYQLSSETYDGKMSRAISNALYEVIENELCIYIRPKREKKENYLFAGDLKEEFLEQLIPKLVDLRKKLGAPLYSQLSFID